LFHSSRSACFCPSAYFFSTAFFFFFLLPNWVRYLIGFSFSCRPPFWASPGRGLNPNGPLITRLVPGDSLVFPCLRAAETLLFFPLHFFLDPLGPPVGVFVRVASVDVAPPHTIERPPPIFFDAFVFCALNPTFPRQPRLLNTCSQLSYCKSGKKCVQLCSSQV